MVRYLVRHPCRAQPKTKTASLVRKKEELVISKNAQRQSCESTRKRFAQQTVEPVTTKIKTLHQARLRGQVWVLLLGGHQLEQFCKLMRLAAHQGPKKFFLGGRISSYCASTRDEHAASHTHFMPCDLVTCVLTSAFSTLAGRAVQKTQNSHQLLFSLVQKTDNCIADESANVTSDHPKWHETVTTRTNITTRQMYSPPEPLLRNCCLYPANLTPPGCVQLSLRTFLQRALLKTPVNCLMFCLTIKAFNSDQRQVVISQSQTETAHTQHGAPHDKAWLRQKVLRVVLSIFSLKGNLELCGGNRKRQGKIKSLDPELSNTAWSTNVYIILSTHRRDTSVSKSSGWPDVPNRHPKLFVRWSIQEFTPNKKSPATHQFWWKDVLSSCARDLLSNLVLSGFPAVHYLTTFIVFIWQRLWKEHPTKHQISSLSQIAWSSHCKQQTCIRVESPPCLNCAVILKTSQNLQTCVQVACTCIKRDLHEDNIAGGRSTRG